MLTSMIRVLIADDHESIRLGLSAVLEAEPDMVVCGLADTGETAATLTHVRSPDVVLIDLSMPGAGGVAAVARIRSTDPAVRVVVVSCHDDPAHVRSAVAAGAMAYILKDDDSAHLVEAVRAAYRGEHRLSADAALALARSYDDLSDPDVTRRGGDRRHRWWRPGRG